jgi:hypothetical protein
MAVRHAFVSAKADPPDTSLARPSDWNAVHETEGAFELVIEGGGAAITTGVKADIVCPFDGTIVSWTLLADQAPAGSLIVSIWRDSYANFPPTAADSIVGSAPPTITAVAKGTSSTLTGWTTAFSKGDILRFSVDDTDLVERVLISLAVTES